MTREVPNPSAPLAEGRTSRLGWLSWIADPVAQWLQDHCLMFSAAISFFAAFSLAPTLVIVISVASVFFGADAVQGRLFDEISGVVGADAAHALEAIVANAWQADMARRTAVLSIAGVLIGASATFSSLHSALNVIWPTPAVSTRDSLFALLRVRLMSFGLVVGAGLLVVVLLVLDALVEVLGHWAFGDGNPFVVLSTLTRRAISLAMLMLAFSVLLKFLPTTRMRWRDAALGAAAAALLFEGGKRLFAFYLQHAGTANMFGAAGSLAIILMWLYYSAAVFLLGAELSATAARKRTHRESGWR
ncbi:YihY/virulence factor BrkB family protein [Caballeronia sp. LZ025]|jgi:membrane protein|uniref:Ribonuclease n=1 Tax=Caballeronia grimmiae TaxID=1071679 RepID=A0A069P764_9BURK|nr:MULTISPECIES: YihY/virulence factor BrkB family protein [Caballeronia]KDR36515.1 ribonuclease BN [Caballeronia grimmiae]MDR5731456.1 YihY/virulence factor BrkB family protein [Caballeronia sp. LZ025]GGD55303.1 ribonuclease [Caballeronia grimmiae]